MELTPLNYGQEIKRLRLKEKIQQQDLAEELGIYPSQLSGIEKGTVQVSRKLFLKALKCLGYRLTEKTQKIT